MLLREKGFTLLELMAALLVLAVLLGIGVPSFNSISESAKIRSVTHDLKTAVQLARSEAITRRQIAIACRSNATQTACDFNSDWSSGWLVLLQNGADPEVAADVNVIRVWGDIDIVASGAAAGFVFERSGAAEAAATMDITNGTDNRCLDVNVSGRVRLREVACP